MNDDLAEPEPRFWVCMVAGAVMALAAAVPVGYACGVLVLF